MAIDTNRAKQLQALAAMAPAANDETKRQLDAARQIQLQSTIQQASPELASTKPGQAIGAQMVQAQGAQAVQQAKTAANDQTQLGQLALQEQGRQMRGEQAGMQAASQNQAMQMANDLQALDMRVKNEMLDKELQFKKDAAGRDLLSERQLLDYAAIKAQSDIDFNKYRQVSDQAWKKKIYLMEASSKRLQQELTARNAVGQQKLSQEQRMKIAQAKVALDRKIEKEKQKAMARSATVGAIGTVAGAVIGGLLTAGSPMGVAAGASIGGGMSTALDAALS